MPSQKSDQSTLSKKYRTQKQNKTNNKNNNNMAITFWRWVLSPPPPHSHTFPWENRLGTTDFKSFFFFNFDSVIMRKAYNFFYYYHHSYYNASRISCSEAVKGSNFNNGRHFELKLTFIDRDHSIHYGNGNMKHHLAEICGHSSCGKVIKGL